MPQSVTVTGDRQAARRVARVGANARDLRAPLRATAQRAARQVTGVPVDTGRLAASVEVLDVTHDSATIGSRVPYAHYVFGGTAYVQARPPRIPSGLSSDAARAVGNEVVR